MFELSQKLQSYINQVEDETKRSVLIEEVQRLELSGMAAAFYPHPTNIHVKIKRVGIENADLEHSIAHEVTHGLLAYGRRYCQVKPKTRITNLERQSIQILLIMVEDIVVNKIIFDEGFPAFAPNYLREVKRETKNVSDKRKDYYFRYSQPFKSRFMVFRYIMAWGFREFYDLNSRKTERILDNFIKAFEGRYPEETQMASQIKEIILANDIFTPEGYDDAIRLGLELWKLDTLVDFVTYN